MSLLDNLVSYWTLSNANDSTATANNLTGNGGGPSTTTGLVGNCSSFDSDTFWSHSDNASLQLNQGDFSIAAWCYLTADFYFSQNYIVSKEMHGSGREFGIYYSASSDYFVAEIGTGSGNTVETVVAGSGIGTGAWHFVVMTYDATAQFLTLSVDNGIPSSSTISLTPGTTSHDFMIGAVATGIGSTNYRWVGKIDEVGLWSKVLTDDEVTYLYNSSSGRTYSDLDDYTPPAPTIYPPKTLQDVVGGQNIALTDGTSFEYDSQLGKVLRLQDPHNYSTGGSPQLLQESNGFSVSIWIKPDIDSKKTICGRSGDWFLSYGSNQVTLTVKDVTLSVPVSTSTAWSHLIVTFHPTTTADNYTGEVFVNGRVVGVFDEVEILDVNGTGSLMIGGYPFESETRFPPVTCGSASDRWETETAAVIIDNQESVEDDPTAYTDSTYWTYDYNPDDEWLTPQFVTGHVGSASYPAGLRLRMVVKIDPHAGEGLSTTVIRRVFVVFWNGEENQNLVAYEPGNDPEDGLFIPDDNEPHLIELDLETLPVEGYSDNWSVNIVFSSSGATSHTVTLYDFDLIEAQARYQGLLKDFRVYNRPLSYLEAEQINRYGERLYEQPSVFAQVVSLLIEGSGDGSMVLSGSCDASVIREGSGDGSFVLSGSCNATKGHAGSGDGSMVLSGAATASPKLRGQGIGACSLSGSAEANADFAGVGTGAASLSGTAISNAEFAGTGTGSASLSGSATGTIHLAVSGSGTGSMILSGYANGGFLVEGSGDGSMSLSGSATASPKIRGVGTGACALTGEAEAERHRAGTGTGTPTLSGIAVGNAEFAGVGTGSASLSGVAIGTIHPADVGSGTGSMVLSGYANGGYLVEGSGDGSMSLSGSAIGSPKVRGTGIGAASLTGSADAVVIRAGIGSGASFLSGEAIGNYFAGGSGAGAAALTGSGNAEISDKIYGTGTGACALSGSANAVVIRAGTGTGSMFLSGQAVGNFITHGSGTGAMSLSGEGSGNFVPLLLALELPKWLKPQLSCKMYPLIIPQGFALPAVTYERSGSDFTYYLNGSISDRRVTTFTFHVFAKSYNEAKGIGDEIVELLHGFTGDIRSVRILSAEVTEESDARFFEEGFDKAGSIRTIEVEISHNHGTSLTAYDHENEAQLREVIKNIVGNTASYVPDISHTRPTIRIERTGQGLQQYFGIETHDPESVNYEITISSLSYEPTIALANSIRQGLGISVEDEFDQFDFDAGNRLVFETVLDLSC